MSTVTDISYDGQGCSISQAATSVLTDQVIGQSVGDALKTVAAFTEMISSRGNVEGDEDVIGDGIAFAGCGEVPGAGEVRAAGLDGLQGCTGGGQADG